MSHTSEALRQQVNFVVKNYASFDQNVSVIMKKALFCFANEPSDYEGHEGKDLEYPICSSALQVLDYNDDVIVQRKK